MFRSSFRHLCPFGYELVSIFRSFRNNAISQGTWVAFSVIGWAAACHIHTKSLSFYTGVTHGSYEVQVNEKVLLYWMGKWRKLTVRKRVSFILSEVHLVIRGTRHDCKFLPGTGAVSHVLLYCMSNTEVQYSRTGWWWWTTNLVFRQHDVKTVKTTIAVYFSSSQQPRCLPLSLKVTKNRRFWLPVRPVYLKKRLLRGEGVLTRPLFRTRNPCMWTDGEHVWLWCCWLRLSWSFLPRMSSWPVRETRNLKNRCVRHCLFLQFGFAGLMMCLIFAICILLAVCL